MKQDTEKLAYVEPTTLVNVVELEGFICASAGVAYATTEVDEFVNKGEVNINFDF